MGARERLVTWLPTLFAIFATGWAGIDWTFRRDLSGGFTYYFTIPDAVVDGVMGIMLLAAAMLMSAGLACSVVHSRRLSPELLARAGYLLAGLSFFLFASGLLLRAAVVGFNDVGGDAYSTATPGWNYMLLSLWLFLTAVVEWGRDLDPYR